MTRVGIQVTPPEGTAFAPGAFADVDPSQVKVTTEDGTEVGFVQAVEESGGTVVAFLALDDGSMLAAPLAVSIQEGDRG